MLLPTIIAQEQGKWPNVDAIKEDHIISASLSDSVNDPTETTFERFFHE